LGFILGAPDATKRNRRLTRGAPNRRRVAAEEVFGAVANTSKNIDKGGEVSMTCQRAVCDQAGCDRIPNSSW